MRIPAPTPAPPFNPTRLPEILECLGEGLGIAGIEKPALLVSGRRGPGLSMAWAEPDVPLDSRDEWPGPFMSPYDGEAFAFQVNLSEMPAGSERHGMPATGMAWVFLDLSGDEGWRTRVVFDPRDPSCIEWAPRHADAAQSSKPRRHRPPEPSARTAFTLPGATPLTLPYADGWAEACEAFDEWAMRNDQTLGFDGLKIGGWNWPCQGDFDERNKTFVAGLSRQSFGDHGEISLHFDGERGFFAIAETH